jgi:hypothetical protein
MNTLSSSPPLRHATRDAALVAAGAVAFTIVSWASAFHSSASACTG